MDFQSTEDDHPDKAAITNAIRAMTDVATAINEYKRRKDLGKLLVASVVWCSCVGRFFFLSGSVFVCVCVCVYVCVCVFVCISVCLHVCVHVNVCMLKLERRQKGCFCIYLWCVPLYLCVCVTTTATSECYQRKDLSEGVVAGVDSYACVERGCVCVCVCVCAYLRECGDCTKER